MIDKDFFEQVFRKVEPESFLDEFLNSWDSLYVTIVITILRNRF